MNVSLSIKAVAKRLLSTQNWSKIKSGLGIEPRDALHTSDLSDVPPADLETLRALDSFTMTSMERRFVLLESVRHLGRAGITGAFVECGVWRGGSSMLMAAESLRLGDVRDIYLYDTFDGMPAPDDMDVDFHGVKAQKTLDAHQGRADSSLVWARAQIDVVRSNLGPTGYPEANLRYVVGKVEDTIPGTMPESIALLRLDTDWYSSTKHELEHLYPLLKPGGILILDDYGYWKGARQAVDEYFAGKREAPMLIRVDQTCRLAVKPGAWAPLS